MVHFFKKCIDKEFPKTHNLLFLGDYVDRGAFGLEVMIYILCLKINYPNQVFLLRGNHETKAMSEGYGFRDEVLAKCGDEEIYNLFCEMFNTIPIAAEINGSSKNKYLCMHGGISPNMQSKKDINAAQRFLEPQPGLVFDLLWADPFPDNECRNHSYGPNMTRDASYFFGLKPVTKLLCEQNYIAIINLKIT